MTDMRAKLRVTKVEKIGADAEVLTFAAVGKHDGYPEDGSDENNTYSRWTPTADLRISITNPALHGKFHEGQQFYVDFTEAS